MHRNVYIYIILIIIHIIYSLFLKNHMTIIVILYIYIIYIQFLSPTIIIQAQSGRKNGSPHPAGFEDQWLGAPEPLGGDHEDVLFTKQFQVSRITEKGLDHC